MTNLIRIKRNKNIVINKKLLNYLNPDYVYIPIEPGYKLYVKTGDTVKKEDILLHKEGKFIYSPISGKVIGATYMGVGKTKTKTMVVENDFTEKTKKISGIKRYINNYSKEEVLTLIKEFNAYNDSFEGQTMIINGIDLEPYVFTNSYLINAHINEILETIDALYSIFGLSRCYFAIKNNDTDNVDKLIHHIGTYPNINLKLMPDLYPLGLKSILIDEIISNKIKEEGIIYLTVSDIYAIYNVLKRKRPITEILITVTGDRVFEAKVVKVKIGSTLKDIIKNNFEIKADDYEIVINGLMSGYEVNNQDFIITQDVKAVFITSIPKLFKKKCINCGMCHIKCPNSCDPRMGYKMDKCIKCGICSYVCPANINFKQKGDK